MAVQHLYSYLYYQWRWERLTAMIEKPPPPNPTTAWKKGLTSMSTSLDYPSSPPARRAYDTDLSDAEWAVVRHLIETVQRGPGPRRSVDLREVVNAILYKCRTRCQWRMLPHDLPPRSTVSGYFQRWSKNGVWEQVAQQLRRLGREVEYPLGFSRSESGDLMGARRTVRKRSNFADRV
jgi:putative transposase